ncbi:MAG: hypothetical protein Terrestrivirus4_72 [Terrestrivirus sp.]|jgi:hypothetical protein|uniref:Uncharacterized protein n=1 Tax=Terrestrivirus sp. TaxID=2487775 RepID=A0A3G4ZNQ2_9VIRU|nr:MAG: hypothetical protein Terrestrivirus4_72 [Terrestrivirus sp.]
MDIKKEEREYNITVSYDVSKLDGRVRESLREKFFFLDQIFDTDNVTVGTFKKVVDSTTYKENKTEAENLCDLDAKCPKRHLELDKILRNNYGICPVVSKTSTKRSAKTFDINYTIKVCVTLPEVDFFDKKINETFTVMQKEALKIIFELDSYPNDIKFITACVNYFEMAKDFFGVFNDVTQEFKDELKAAGKKDKVNVNMSVTTNARHIY